MLQSLALPDDLPPISSAKLPATYEAAKTALAECERIDECAAWAWKMEALASYARMAGDYELRKMADRIQARAMRRAGELIKELKPQPGRRTDLEPEFPAEPRTRTETTSQAGISARQRKTALHVANVPDDQFRELVDSDNPPTVTALAELGKTPRPRPVLASIDGIDPADRAASARGQDLLMSLAAVAAEVDPATIVRGATGRERQALASDAKASLEWLERLIGMLKTQSAAA